MPVDDSLYEDRAAPGVPREYGPLSARTGPEER